MKGIRTPLIFCIGMLAAHIPAHSALQPAPILEEVERHLNLAQDDLQRGDFDSARGHSAAVLIGDEITYSVSYQSVQPGLRKLCSDGLASAVSIWEKGMKGTIHFREVTSSDRPQIVVVFKPDVRMGTEAVAGYTNWKRAIRMDGRHLLDSTYHADMQLRSLDLSYQPMSFEVIRHEACHEFGHVLGLDDSTTGGEVMAPLDLSHPVNGPSESELLAIRNLRERAKLIQSAALAQGASKL